MESNWIHQLEQADRLAVLMQSVGFTIWQLQELETTVASYLVIRVHAQRSIGIPDVDALLRKAHGRTFGSLLTELTKSHVIDDRLGIALREILGQRNWLVHHARREKRGILSNDDQLSELLRHLEGLAARSLELHKALATELENYVLQSGVDRAFIDAESDRLSRIWSLIE